MKTFGNLKAKASSQKGYSLIEISIALAIISVILIGGLMGTRQVLLSNSVNGQAKDTAAVIAKISRHYAKQTDTKGTTVHNLARLGVWPAERVTVNQANTVSTIRGVITGTRELVFSNESDIGSLAANTGFIYTIRMVPVDACAELVSALDPMALAIYVGAAAASASDPTSGVTPTSTAVKAADASTISLTALADGCKGTGATALDVAMVVRP